MTEADTKHKPLVDLFTDEVIVNRALKFEPRLVDHEQSEV